MLQEISFTLINNLIILVFIVSCFATYWGISYLWRRMFGVKDEIIKVDEVVGEELD
ncbi:MAG: hypothetical protein NTX03_06650 [Bacteroidetes bacterium]|nr:hypothetical protein [Bacteroidota bacterium]